MNAMKEPLDAAGRSGGRGLKRRRPEPLRTSAYHEAGHAVISAAVRRGVDRLTIVPDGDSAAACHLSAALDELTEYGYSSNAESVFLRDLAATMAGTISGCVAEGQRPRWTAKSGILGYFVAKVGGRRRRVRIPSRQGDLWQATDILLRLIPNGGEEQEHLSDRVWQLTVRELRTRWPQVRAVAAFLLEKRTVSGRRTLRIIRERGERTGPLAAALSVIARERRVSREKLHRKSAREWRENHPEEARQLRELAENLRRSGANVAPIPAATEG